MPLRPGRGGGALGQSGPPPWVANYIGLPWRTLGRDRSGLDCWGLLRLVIAEQRGVQLPAFDGGGYTGQRAPEDLAGLARFIRGSMGGWLPVDFTDRRAFDGILFVVRGRPIHIGMVVSAGWFLHVQRGHDAAIEPFDSMHWTGRIAGIFRHEALA